MINDERIKALIDDFGMKGFGLYSMMRLHVECIANLPLSALSQLIPNHTSRRLFHIIMNDYQLFYVDAFGIVRTRVDAPVRAAVPAAVPEFAHGDTDGGTDAVHCSDLKNKSESEIGTHTQTPVFEEPELFDDFLEKMRQSFPGIMSMQKPLLKSEYKKLKEMFGKDLVVRKIVNLENKPELEKKYKSAYFTLLNWCKEDKSRLTS